MARDRRGRRPWRRRTQNSSTDPGSVFRELQRRQLNNLEDCRLAWERGADPRAVCVAVTKAELPRWLADALLVLLGAEDVGKSVKRHWRRVHQDSIDAVRAQAVALLRSHPDFQDVSWEQARL